MLGPLPQVCRPSRSRWISLADFVRGGVGGLPSPWSRFADTSVLSRAYAADPRAYVDPNEEMGGLGRRKTATGFFQGFRVSSSSSRTPAAEAARAKTQLTGVVGAPAVGPLLFVAPI